MMYCAQTLQTRTLLRKYLKFLPLTWEGQILHFSDSLANTYIASIAAAILRFCLSKYYLPSLSARWYSESKGPHPSASQDQPDRVKGETWSLLAAGN